MTGDLSRSVGSRGEPWDLLVAGCSVGQKRGSVSSGTCPSSLLDRVERSATPGLLTVLAGGATAGGRDAPLGTLVTLRIRWGSLLVNVWCGSSSTGGDRLPEPCRHEQRSQVLILRMGIDIAVLFAASQLVDWTARRLV